LRELLSEEPDLAKIAGKGGTPLMWLPDDEARAIEIVELLLAHGADPTIKDQEGMTAADYAEKRETLEDLDEDNACSHFINRSPIQQ
jgi:uncharacterized protein